MNQRDSKSVLQATLGETYSLYEGLEKEGLRVTTIEDSFLTIEGLIRGVDTYPAHLPGDEPQQGRNFSVYVNNGIIPLMTRYEGDNPVFTFGIVTHKVDGKTKKLQESDAVLVSLDDLFKITDFYSKNDKKVRYVLLSLKQAQEILSNELLSNQTARRKYLKGIDADTTAVESYEAVLKHAISKGITDIHIEPQGEGKNQIRYRYDGILVKGDYELTDENVKKLAAIIKNKANLKMDEHHRPQDGGITFSESDIRENSLLDGYSLRVSVMPTVFGEKAEIRLLKSKEIEYKLDNLGLPSSIRFQIRKKIAEPHGLVLVTGPTGSGKTTTLYSILQELNDGTRNISTIEDPVEIVHNGMVQTQVNRAVGFDFSEALRALLRQDPDVILVGEIRDKETAEAAINAANTGHMVFSTVHADDSISTLLRLQRLGVDPEYLASGLKAVLSQRLVRELCPDCSEAYNAQEDLKHLLGADHFNSEIWIKRTSDSKDCRHCEGIGYKGRFMIPELWIPEDVEREMILSKVASHETYFAEAVKRGFEPLVYNAVKSLIADKTSIDELLRVAITEDEFLRRGKMIGQSLTKYVNKIAELRDKK